MSVVSEHKDRVVYDRGDRFVKEFRRTKDRDAELENLRLLEAAGVRGPEVLDTSGSTLVTARLPGEPLDELIPRRWASLPRPKRNDIIRRVAEVCRRVRDAGFDWPDLVTYHVYISDTEVRVLDPARLRRGRLDLSPLYWSTAEPTVSRADRLRFWRAYAGDAPPPALRPIGHRGRFHPFRWVCQATMRKRCPDWAPFVNAIDAPFQSADDIAAHPKLRVRRELADRVNAVLGKLVVKITKDPDEARREWENHQRLLGTGWRVPQPAVGGILSDGRGLFSTVRLDGLHPVDDVWPTLDRRRAVRAIADIARRLHACGLVHKDLYLCHLFVAKGGEELTLIDLARTERTTSARLRVKDLAALLHSARGFLSRTDLMRGLKRYGGDKRLARRVLKKAAKMARHVPRNVRDGTHVPHEPCE